MSNKYITNLFFSPSSTSCYYISECNSNNAKANMEQRSLAQHEMSNPLQMLHYRSMGSGKTFTRRFFRRENILAAQLLQRMLSTTLILLLFLSNQSIYKYLTTWG